MNTSIKLNIQGEVELLINRKTILKENNNISPDALKVIMMALPLVPNPVNVDTVEVEGDFGLVTTQVIDSNYDSTSGSITFISKIGIAQAVGSITDLRLKSQILDLALATKVGLTINKNDSTEIEVRWKITITNN